MAFRRGPAPPVHGGASRSSAQARCSATNSSGSRRARSSAGVATGSPGLRRGGSAERLPSTTAALRASDLHLASHPLTLSYSPDGGASWTVIAAGVTNSGSLAWDTPFTATLQGLVKVEAVDEIGHTGSDVSDGVFAVLAPDSAWSRVYLPIILRAAHPSSPEPSLLPPAMPMPHRRPR